MTDNPFTIDEYNLDKEWVRQPILMYQHATELANARREMDEAAAAISVVKGDLDKQLREAPFEHGLTKATEAVIENAIPTQPEYKAAVAHHIDCKHKVKMLEAAVTALENKKRALEGLVSLLNMNYFSSPKVSGDETTSEAEKRLARRMGTRKN